MHVLCAPVYPGDYRASTLPVLTMPTLTGVPRCILGKMSQGLPGVAHGWPAAIRVGGRGRRDRGSEIS